MTKYQRVFFSYSRSDASAFALRLANDLMANGIPVWVDQLHIPLGAAWDTEIEKALELSDCLLFIMSTNSIASENVLNEINFALEARKKVLPVLLNDCRIPLRVSRFQYVDFREDYEAALGRLLPAFALMDTDVQVIKGIAHQKNKDVNDKNNIESEPPGMPWAGFFASPVKKQKLLFIVLAMGVVLAIAIVLKNTLLPIQQGSFECSNLSPADTFWVVKARINGDFDVFDHNVRIKMRSGWVTYDLSKKNNPEEKLTITSIRPSIVKFIDKQVGTWDYVSRGQRQTINKTLLKNDTLLLPESVFTVDKKTGIDLTECWIVFDILLRSNTAVEGDVPIRSYVDVFN